jgi:hypothetical protein
MPKSKVSAFLSVLLVFASGAAMGAVGYRLYVVKTVTSTGQPPSKKKANPEEFRKLIMSKLKDAVKLDAQQVDQIQKIYDDEGDWFTQSHKKFDAQVDQIHKEFAHERDLMHDSSVAKIKTILRPDQEPLYEKWTADRAADRKRHQEQQQQQGQRPGQGPRNDGHRPPPLP